MKVQIFFAQIKKNYPLILLALLFFVLSSIFYEYSPSWVILGLNVYVLPLYLASVLLLYILVYLILELEVYIQSFLAFLANVSILILYMRGFYILYCGISYPVHLSDLSQISQYRYLVFVIISLGGILLYGLSLKYLYISSAISKIMFPYLKEEFRRILYIQNESIFGPICSWIIDKLDKSLLFRIFFFLVHFIVFYSVRVYLLYLFVNFVFLEGDLRPILYCLPLSFVIWILRFFDYYFNTFFEGSHGYIKSLLVLEFEIEEPRKYRFGLLKLQENSLKSIALTQKALSEGLCPTQNNVNVLYDIWVSHVHVQGYFSLYKKIIKSVDILISLLRIFCWVYLVNFFFFCVSNESVSLVSPFYRIISRSFHATPPRYAPPSEVYYVHRRFSE